MNKIQKKVAADIREYGWHAVGVANVEGETDVGPPFSYTIGFEDTFDHPEVVIFGLNNDHQFMHYILSEIAKRIAKGERFEHGAKKKNLLPGFVCPFARFPKSAYDAHLGQALVWHGSPSFRAVQCIWPDPKKRLPWDPKFIYQLLEREPVFLRPDAGPRDPKWPFTEPHSRIAITSRQVATGKEPVRYIGRFPDGSYQFVCTTTDRDEDIVRTTFGWLYDHDPTVKVAAKLKPGSAVHRDELGSTWKKAPAPE
ncbi:MAG: DUF4262 domain-containing protein [Deltaproteobacteria bacterium]|nr:DUF4262 domain-containing protein [Deltaproteobacteria bacterium]